MPMPSMPSMPSLPTSSGGVTQASYRSSSGTGAVNANGAVERRGNAKCGPAGFRQRGGRRPDAVLKVGGQHHGGQGVPMDKGVDTTVCCANFASACLVEVGRLSPAYESRVDASQRIKGDGWRTVSTKGESNGYHHQRQ